MGFSLGIVGVPNVGKSTLFNALCGANIANVANYPFCTIEPHRAVIAVPDERLKKLAPIFTPEKITPTTLEFIDIAGLVKNAHRGEGLGNKFLSHIRECDAIAHIVRCFVSEEVSHVDGSIEPVRDFEVVQTELQLRDIETISERKAKEETRAKSGKKEDIEKVHFIEQLEQWLNTGKSAVGFSLNGVSEELIALKESLFLLTDKPLLVIANVSATTESELAKDASYQKLLKYCSGNKLQLIPVSAALEAEIGELEESERAEFYKELGVGESALSRVIHAGYEALNLITYFTGNKNELCARTLKKGSNAVTAAGKIHTDFAKGFIRADVINCNDLTQAGSLTSARDKGILRSEGKNYIVQDGDVIQYHFNV